MPTLPAAYRYLRRQRQAARPLAVVLTFGYLLAVLVLRLEGPAWQRLLAEHRYLFPHLVNRPMKAGDPLRYLLQGLWLLLVRPFGEQRVVPALRPLAEAGLRPVLRAGRQLGHQNRRFNRRLNRLPDRVGEHAPLQRLLGRLARLEHAGERGLHYGLVLLATLLALLSITVPFSYGAQLVFILLLWGIAMLVRNIPGSFPTLMLVVLSTIVSCRYLWWRYTSTLNWNSTFDLVCTLTLLAAETYAWVILILGFIQTCWPLERKPAQLPADTSTWPTVDLMIPTYNEDLSVVRTTVLAALGLDWPRDKLRIHILDDGKREVFRQFAEEVGVGYIIRKVNNHAKAGNLNHALGVTDGELIAIFDCDHVPVRSFLQVTVGWFLADPKMALVQTPHHFFSPDPFERNLGTFHRMPNEGELFYGLIQAGNDMWNAAFFCGSCAVLRRTAIESVGGFAVETVTEDAHTALRLHRAGWNSAYLRVPQAAGLATESLSAHIGQRIRWARGMVQIFRTDNPLLGRGLSVFQRVCYANAMLHFLSGIPRIIFLTAPLAFLIFHAYIIYAPAAMILLYVLPHIIHASLTNSRMQGQYRHSFWGEVYETVLAWYIARPTTVALLDPGKGKFNVTAKGGLMEENQFDWRIARPYLALAVLNVIGLGMAGWRLYSGPVQEVGTVIVSSLWVVYNMLIIGAAVAVAAEVRQIRRSHRIPARLPASLRLQGGHLVPCTLIDFSDSGAGLRRPDGLALAPGEPVTLVLQRGRSEASFRARVTRCVGQQIGLQYEPLSLAEQIELVQCTFARADLWLGRHPDYRGDRPLASFFDVVRFGGRGYYRLLEHLPDWLARPLRRLFDVFAWLSSFLPRTPLHRPTAPSVPTP